MKINIYFSPFEKHREFYFQYECTTNQLLHSHRMTFERINGLNETETVAAAVLIKDTQPTAAKDVTQCGREFTVCRIALIRIFEGALRSNR